MNKKLFILIMLAAFLVTGVVLAEDRWNATSTPAKPPVDLVCMQNAIEKRDSAIISAWDTFHSTTKSALQARKDALKAAWAKTDKKERKEAIKKAWSDYKKAAKNARKAFNKAKLDAWKQFYKDRKTCRGTGDDSTTMSADNQL